ncbi:beta-lactamase/transpeptidase-like protein [Catenaria anguillulae PL171]|uniref:Beta-lactamase/transpeptidase-like protein n=1 Tax=Catenaria anguillulae PL171 TaxID=765915 RepID=A0A1Y2I139_9FUNG|nr:beta-lactamase/transpeptidase-like protein [Catenaria anguillulae PL171]
MIRHFLQLHRRSLSFAASASLFPPSLRGTLKTSFLVLARCKMTTDAKIKSNATSPSAIHGPVRDLESSLPEILAALQVPGLTVSVFKDGEQLLHRGFGTRILGRDDTPVDTDTLFDLCSITKHITAAAASKLVHDGKLKWNEPVTKYMPTWQFSDPVLTKSVTMVDLLSHRTGLAGHNEMQMGNRNGNLSAGHRDPADFLPHLAMGDQFRSSGIYSNLSFALATRVIEEVSGQAYPDFVAEHLFDPLGIKDYEWCYHAFAKHPNAALPHVWPRPIRCKSMSKSTCMAQKSHSRIALPSSKWWNRPSPVWPCARRIPLNSRLTLDIPKTFVMLSVRGCFMSPPTPWSSGPSASSTKARRPTAKGRLCTDWT